MMKDKPLIFQNLVPFFVVGISIALLLALLFVFAYVLVWGLIIGGILWIGYALKCYFFPSETAHKPIQKKEKGRIIDHEDKS